MGAMNMIGTLGSGWLCDRFGRRGPLAIYYFVRGLSLIFLLYVWDVPSLHLWAALFGLNYISTVPPTTTLTANIYGRFSVGELSGWIFFAHQVGSALGAAGAGWIFEWTGSYSRAFVSAAIMAFLAAGMALMIREVPVRSRPLTPPSPLRSALPASPWSRKYVKTPWPSSEDSSATSLGPLAVMITRPRLRVSRSRNWSLMLPARTCCRMNVRPPAVPL